MAAVDDNSAPLIYGVSHRDGVTPVAIKFTAQRGIEVDDTTTILFNPTVVSNQTPNDRPFAKGTSEDDDNTVLPWVVNADTGAVLIEA